MILLITLSYLIIAVSNASIIVYFKKSPLQRNFGRFLPCFYFVLAAYTLFAVFDYRLLAYILHEDVVTFIHTSMICDINYTTAMCLLLIDNFYTLYLALDLISQRFFWRDLFTKTVLVTVHFWLTEVSCSHLGMMLFFVKLSVFLQLFGFFIVIVSLGINFSNESFMYRFMLFIATAVEVPECFVKIVFPMNHPINEYSVIEIRVVFYGLCQMVFAASYFVIGRKTEDQPEEEEEEEMKFTFENPSVEYVYV